MKNPRRDGFQFGWTNCYHMLLRQNQHHCLIKIRFHSSFNDNKTSMFTSEKEYFCRKELTRHNLLRCYFSCTPLWHLNIISSSVFSLCSIDFHCRVSLFSFNLTILGLFLDSFHTLPPRKVPQSTQDLRLPIQDVISQMLSTQELDDLIWPTLCWVTLDTSSTVSIIVVQCNAH